MFSAKRTDVRLPAQMFSSVVKVRNLCYLHAFKPLIRYTGAKHSFFASCSAHQVDLLKVNITLVNGPSAAI